MSAYLSLIGRRRGGRLFEAGRLLTVSASRIGAYSRLGAYSNKYRSRFIKTHTLPILGLQSRDKAVMLVVKSIIFFSRIYIKMVFTSQRREMLCSWPGTNMATVTSRANQQHLSLILSNSRSSLKTPFHLRSRCSNGRGKGANRASESANGTRERREMASRSPHPPTPPPPRSNAHAQVFPFTLLLLQAQLFDPPSDIFVFWSSSFTLIRSKVFFVLCLLSLSCT